MSEDSYESVLADLYDLYPGETILPMKETHRKIAHLSHGWYMRAKRSCLALMLLRESGYACEAWPLRRAVIEHMLALRWLAEKGNEAKDVVVRTHGESARRRQEASQTAGWESAGWPVWEAVQADASAALTNVSEDNILSNVRARCEKYGTPHDYASWLIETNNTHPGWETAQCYVQREPLALLIEPDFDMELGDASFCSRRLLRSLVALGDMAEESSFGTSLTDVAARLAALDAQTR